MNQLTILFDADDTAEDLVSAWTHALNERYGTNVGIEDITDWDITKSFPSLSSDQIFGILEEDTVWRNLQPMPDSQNYLSLLQNEGHNLYMVTATKWRTVPFKLPRLLELFPFMDDSHIILAHEKQIIHGDVLIDDKPENLIGGRYFRILYDRPHNRNFRESWYGIYRTTNWAEVYRTIREDLLYANESEWR